MAERSLDIFKVLDALNAKNVNFYSNLTPEERKGFQPFLVSRWMSGTFDTSQVYLINEFVNPYAFSLQKHQPLLWQLLTVCNSGKKQRYSWNKLPGRRETGRPNAVKCVMQYFGYNTAHAVDAVDILTRTQILDMAGQLGWQPEEITKIRRELKAADDPTEKPSKQVKTKKQAEQLLEF